MPTKPSDSRSIAGAFASYLTMTEMEDAGPDQLREMRRAFYGGAWVVLCHIRKIAEPGVSEEEGVATLGMFMRECEDFVEAVTQGRK